MTRLRKQLQAAADEHRALRYPGSLAEDVLGAQPAAPRRRAWWPVLLVPVGVAAVLALALWASTLLEPRGPVRPQEIAEVPGQAPEAAAAMVAAFPDSVVFPSQPSVVPGGMQMAIPAMQVAIPAMPTFPSFDASVTGGNAADGDGPA